MSFHPFPLYEGQCLIFNNGYKQYQEITGKQDEENVLEIKGAFDFSLTERIDVGKNYADESLRAKLTNESTKTFLNNEETNFFEPLSIQDWQTTHKVVKSTDSIAFMQLLPAGKKSYRKLSSGVVSVVPRQFLLKEYKNFGILDKKNSDEKLPFEKFLEETFESQGRLQSLDQAAIRKIFNII